MGDDGGWGGWGQGGCLVGFGWFWWLVGLVLVVGAKVVGVKVVGFGWFWWLVGFSRWAFPANFRVICVN